tara:strand:+ start:172 stop:1005 length:834 start_codon:yes stop_codon:yes gene_type:complete
MTKLGTIITIAALGFTGAALAEDAQDFGGAFRALMPALMSSEWETALPLAQAALPLAETPAERYRIRHILTDINARLHNWDEAARWSHEAAAIIHADAELTETRIIMASHMAAEEGRAVAMLDDHERLTDANARAIADHPEAAPNWQAVGETGAVHAAGLSCDLLRDGYLRFDVHGSQTGPAACTYWNHADIGIRLTQGTALDAELIRLAAENPTFDPIELEAEFPRDAQLATYSIGAPFPGGELREIVVAQWPERTLTLTYPVSARGDALAALTDF